MWGLRVRGRKTRASFLPNASLATRNSQFGWLGLGVAPKFYRKFAPKPRNFNNHCQNFVAGPNFLQKFRGNPLPQPAKLRVHSTEKPDSISRSYGSFESFGSFESLSSFESLDSF